MTNKTTVTIGIPAYQSEDNIVPLLVSLIDQKQSKILIEKILVYTDGCKDKTAQNALSVKSKKIEVFVSKKNRGYAYSLQYLINKNKSEIFVALNDDIKIKSLKVIEYLVKPILNDPRIGLIGGNVCALKPRTFIGRCVYTSYLAFLPLRLKYKQGLTRLTNDGKIMALTKKFSKSLDLNNSSVGNVDIYIYLKNLELGNLYRFSKNAKVYFRLPETIKDFRNWESRTQKSYAIILRQFKKLAAEELNIPKKEYLVSAVQTFFKFPLETIVFKLIIKGFIFRQKNIDFKKWEIAKSTKNL